jgi:hypothetical protein
MPGGCVEEAYIASVVSNQCRERPPMKVSEGDVIFVGIQKSASSTRRIIAHDGYQPRSSCTDGGFGLRYPCGRWRCFCRQDLEKIDLNKLTATSTICLFMPALQPLHNSLQRDDMCEHVTVLLSQICLTLGWSDQNKISAVWSEEKHIRRNPSSTATQHQKADFFYSSPLFLQSNNGSGQLCM